MRTRVVALALLLCGAAGTALADDYADFRVPDYKVLTWDLIMRGRASTSRFRNESFSPGISDQARSSGGDFNLSAPGSWLHQTDRASTAIDWSPNASGRRQRQRIEQFGGPVAERREVADRSAREAWGATLRHERYETALPIAWGGRLTTAGSLEQDWSRGARAGTVVDTLQGERQYDSARRAGAASLSGAMTLGVGRIRDVTPVADAREIEARLLERGVLARPLSREGRQRLARLVAMDDAFVRTSQRPLAAEFDAIEGVLRDDGALRDPGQDVAAAVRVLEPWIGADAARLPHSPVRRARGVAVTAFADGSLEWTRQRFADHFYGRTRIDDTTTVVSDSRFTASRHSRSDRVVIGGRGEVQWPLGQAFQLGLASEASTPVGHQRPFTSIRTGGSFAAIVADRWIASVMLQHSRDFYRDAARQWHDPWNTLAAARVSWFLVDHLAFTLAASDNQHGGAGYAREDMVSFELTWRLARRLTSPDLLAEPSPRPD